MKAVVFFSLSIIVLGVKAWPRYRKPFSLQPSSEIIISDCMHVASEPGDYVFKKMAHLMTTNRMEENFLEIDNTVCGLYIISPPDTIVEIGMRHYDVSCESGGLMAFIDGWELNGEYFPGIKDHQRSLEKRVSEFCNKKQRSVLDKKYFRSSQNAALLQYRIPVRGSFIAHVRFQKITQPCNVLVHNTEAIYNLANFGDRRNCTLSAIFPAAVALSSFKIGDRSQENVANYDCLSNEDRLEIGGSTGIDASAMEKASNVCGYSEAPGPEQAIFCEVTTVRLVSSGGFKNQAAINIRKADENDLNIATLVCAL